LSSVQCAPDTASALRVELGGSRLRRVVATEVLTLWCVATSARVRLLRRALPAWARGSIYAVPEGANATLAELTPRAGEFVPASDETTRPRSGCPRCVVLTPRSPSLRSTPVLTPHDAGTHLRVHRGRGARTCGADDDARARWPNRPHSAEKKFAALVAVKDSSEGAEIRRGERLFVGILAQVLPATEVLPLVVTFEMPHIHHGDAVAVGQPTERLHVDHGTLLTRLVFAADTLMAVGPSRIRPCRVSVASRSSFRAQGHHLT